MQTKKSVSRGKGEEQRRGRGRSRNRTSRPLPERNSCTGITEISTTLSLSLCTSSQTLGLDNLIHLRTPHRRKQGQRYRQLTNWVPNQSNFLPEETTWIANADQFWSSSSYLTVLKLLVGAQFGSEGSLCSWSVWRVETARPQLQTREIQNSRVPCCERPRAAVGRKGGLWEWSMVAEAVVAGVCNLPLQL